MTSTLYEQDYYLWLKKTASLLRDGRLSELDIANLLEEIEDMGRSQKQAVKSNLRIVLWHLLKSKYQLSTQCFYASPTSQIQYPPLSTSFITK